MAKRLVTTKEVVSQNLTTDDIEEILLCHFSRKGWEVRFRWNVGQWVNLDVERSRTETVEQDTDLLF